MCTTNAFRLLTDDTNCNPTIQTAQKKARFSAWAVMTLLQSSAVKCFVVPRRLACPIEAHTLRSLIVCLPDIFSSAGEDSWVDWAIFEECSLNLA